MNLFFVFLLQESNCHEDKDYSLFLLLMFPQHLESLPVPIRHSKSDLLALGKLPNVFT